MSMKPSAWRRCEYGNGNRPPATGDRSECKETFFRPAAYGLQPSLLLMNELRWILLAASIVLLAWIYIHGRRKGLATAPNEARPRRDREPPQLEQNAIVRERHRMTAMGPSISHAAPAEIKIDDLPEIKITTGPATLSMDAALSTSALERLAVTQPLSDARAIAERALATRIEPSRNAPHIASADKPRAARKIVAIRVAGVHQQFSGERLKEWFAMHELKHGKYEIFHRYDERGDLIFSVASMVEPGTFDRTQMTETQYPGVSL